MAQFRAISSDGELLIRSVLPSAECLSDVRRFAAPPGRGTAELGCISAAPAFITSLAARSRRATRMQ